MFRVRYVSSQIKTDLMSLQDRLTNGQLMLCPWNYLHNLAIFFVSWKTNLKSEIRIPKLETNSNSKWPKFKKTFRTFEISIFILFRPALARCFWNNLRSLRYFAGVVIIGMLCYPGLGQGFRVSCFEFAILKTGKRWCDLIDFFKLLLGHNTRRYGRD